MTSMKRTATDAARELNASDVEVDDVIRFDGFDRRVVSVRYEGGRIVIHTDADCWPVVSCGFDASFQVAL